MKHFQKKIALPASLILLSCLFKLGNVCPQNFETAVPGENLNNEPPLVKIFCKSSEGFAPLEVEFSSEGTIDPDGKILSRLWTFGDGEESNQPNPRHIYKKAATYFVRFGIMDDKNTMVVSEPLKIIVKDNSLPGINKKRLLDFQYKQLKFAYKENFRLKDMYRSGPYVKNEIDVAGTGFALAGLCISAEHGLIPKEKAEEFALATILRCLQLQGDSQTSFEGFLYHFYCWDHANERFFHKSDVEISTIDTALLLAGVITAGEYFGGRVKEKAEEFYSGINWKKFFDFSRRKFHMAYKKVNFFGYWDYYTDEILLISLFSAGAPNPDFRVFPEDAFSGWRVNKGRYNLGNEYVYSWFGSLFTYLYAHMFFDFKNLGRERFSNIDWWENSRRAAQADIDYCRDNSYAENVWGLSACWSQVKPRWDEWEYRFAVGGGLSGEGIRFDNKKNGVWPIASHAAISALPFFNCDGDFKDNPAFLTWDFMEKNMYNHEGFIIESLDANTLDKEGRPFSNSAFTVGMDILTPAIMIENAFSGFVWKYFMQNRRIRNACEMVFLSPVLN